MTDSAVASEVHSQAEIENQFDLVANTTGSMKVIVTKQGESGRGTEIIDEGQYGQLKGNLEKLLPMLNQASGKVLPSDDLNVVGTVLNEGSDVNLSAGVLGISPSDKKV